MLKLRRGVVVDLDPLIVDVGGERRQAWADEALVGSVEVGDEVIVNTQATDLGLGSGGFDLVHVNLTRGLEGSGAAGVHVMKLNYTPIQHAVAPIETRRSEVDAGRAAAVPVLVIPLHGHLPPAAWAAARALPGARVGFVQTPGGALPGGLSRDVAELRRRDLLAGHISAGASYGGEAEAISTVGALDAAARALGWDAVIAGPGPGILGSASAYGHGGMAALETAHAALALGMPTVISPRLSSSDPRDRHRGLSHHTATVLRLLLASVRVAAPEVEAERWADSAASAREDALDELIEVCGDRHDVDVRPVDLDTYVASELPTTTMGRDIAEDPLFFAAALAAGDALAASAGESQ